MMPILAYVDPGTGSLAFQALAGALLGVAFWMRARIAAGWRRLLSLFRRKGDGA